MDLFYFQGVHDNYVLHYLMKALVVIDFFFVSPNGLEFTTLAGIYIAVVIYGLHKVLTHYFKGKK